MNRLLPSADRSVARNKASPLDRGDNAWLFTSSALVADDDRTWAGAFYCGLVPKEERPERDDAVRVSHVSDDRDLGIVRVHARLRRRYIARIRTNHRKSRSPVHARRAG